MIPVAIVSMIWRERIWKGKNGSGTNMYASFKSEWANQNRGVSSGGEVMLVVKKHVNVTGSDRDNTQYG